MNTVRAASVRVMPPGTSSRNRLATPVTCRRCGMNTVREAAVRVMPPDTETKWQKVPHRVDEVRHQHGTRSGGNKVRQSTMRQAVCGMGTAGNAARHLLPQSAGYASNVSEVPA